VPTALHDLDGDGFEGPGGDDTDCDDSSSAIHPDAVEVCNGIDDDCNEETVEVQRHWYADTDNDGFGDPDSGQDACDKPDGHVVDDTDCDDTAASTNPLGAEICNGLDDDCNSAVDDDASDGVVWYADSDADGFGDSGSEVRICSGDATDGVAAQSGDCADFNPNVAPNLVDDCTDLNVDNNCDGTPDDAAPVWHPDTDADGFGDAASPVVECTQPTNHISDGTDCDDSLASVNPSASETCTGLDDDCNGLVDDDPSDGVTFYADQDGDGWGSSVKAIVACSLPLGYSTVSGDCQGNPLINPGAIDASVDGTDQNCDGVDGTDADGDGYAGVVTGGTDCNDSDGDTSPEAGDAVGDGVDSNCDGIDGTDADGDGDASMASGGNDCDDGEPLAHSTATEVCSDGIDNDCDGGMGHCRFDEDLGNTTPDLVGHSSGSAHLGYFMTGMDFDGDGILDLAATSRGTDDAQTDGGSVLIYKGPISPGAEPAVQLIGDLRTGQTIGWELFNVGDLNADGNDAILVSKDTAAVGGANNGEVFLFADLNSGDVLTSEATLHLIGVDESRLGYAIGGGHDVRGTGDIPDLVSGARAIDGFSGEVYIHSGDLTGQHVAFEEAMIIRPPGTGNYLGYATATADLNGDGTAEVLATAISAVIDQSAEGVLFSFEAPITGDLSTADATGSIRGNSANHNFGTGLWVSDVDGDGAEDALVGASLDDTNGPDAGVIFVFTDPLPGGGATADAASTGQIYGLPDADAPEKNFGFEFKTIGDVDGDGNIDLMAPHLTFDAPDLTPDSGRAFLFYGPLASGARFGDDPGTGYIWGNTAHRWATSSAGLGDQDEDGIDDFAVGTHLADFNGEQSGAIHLFMGRGL